MITQIFCSRDLKADAFGQPFTSQSIGVAERSFIDEVNRADVNNPLYNHPEDFQLFHLGSFNDSDGSFDLIIPPRLIASGSNVKAI